MLRPQQLAKPPFSLYARFSPEVSERGQGVSDPEVFQFVVSSLPRAMDRQGLGRGRGPAWSSIEMEMQPYSRLLRRARRTAATGLQRQRTPPDGRIILVRD